MRRTEAARDTLLHVQRQIQNRPGNEDFHRQEKEALCNLVFFSTAKESFIRQKSRALWIKEGDQNSKYFHGCLKDRVNNNKILSLTLEDGTQLFNPSDIHLAAIEHFKNLFSEDATATADPLDLSYFVSKSISPSKATELISRVTEEEIKSTIFKMSPDKAPRPDGYNAFFFQKT